MKIFYITLATLSLALLSGCGKKSTGGTLPTVVTNVTTGVVSTNLISATPLDLPGVITNAAPVEVVPEEPLPTAAIATSTLKALLPETIRGYEFYRAMERTNVTYTTQTTYAERTFFGQNSSILVFRIKDAHKPNMVNLDANQIKKQPELNTDTEELMERVTEYEGFPCYEKFVKTRSDAKIQVLVEDRVMVELTGIKMGIDDLRPLMRFYDVNLIREHVAEEVRQQEARARQERDAQKAAGN